MKVLYKVTEAALKILALEVPGSVIGPVAVLYSYFMFLKYNYHINHVKVVIIYIYTFRK